MSAKVVATATGVISGLGAGLEKFGCALFAGRSAAGQSARFPGITTAEITDFHPQEWLGNKGIRVLDRSARLLAVAAQMALRDSGMPQDAQETGDADLGLVCGTVFGGLHSIASFDWSGITEGPSLVNPMEFPNTVINAPAGQAAIRHKLRGVNSTVCAGLASGLHAIHYAAEFLRFGRARALLAGGVEELCEESVNGFRATGAISQSGHGGMVPGEGSALWMLETEESALARGRPPWIEICGFGCSQDTRGVFGFDPQGRAAAAAIRQALADSGIAAGDVGCVVASANGSRAGDEMEARALEAVFGGALARVPVCAPKAAFGEAMGASGALCAVAAGLALQKQAAPPTAAFSLDGTWLPLSPQAVPISGEYALVNAFGCDGNNAALVVRLWKN